VYYAGDRWFLVTPATDRMTGRSTERNCAVLTSVLISLLRIL
jgi:hypothetical protein